MISTNLNETKKHLYYAILVFEEHNEITLIKNQFYDTIPILFKQWKFSVEINPFKATDGWTNICRVGHAGNCSILGDRVPALFFYSNTTKLHICSAIDSEKNYAINPANALPLNEWTKVEITQYRQADGTYKYTICVGGEEVHTKIHVPREFYDLKVRVVKLQTIFFNQKSCKILRIDEMLFLSLQYAKFTSLSGLH